MASFSDLPIEIRLRIWRDSLHSRIVILRTHEGLFPSEFIWKDGGTARASYVSRRFCVRTATREAAARPWVTVLILGPTASALFVCRESRGEALQTYSRICPIPALPNNRSFYFNPKKDVLYLDMHKELYLPCRFLYPELSQARSIAIWDRLDWSEFLWYQVPDSTLTFPNITKLYLIDWYRHPDNLENFKFSPRRNTKREKSDQALIEKAGLVESVPQIRYADPRAATHLTYPDRKHVGDNLGGGTTTKTTRSLSDKRINELERIGESWKGYTNAQMPEFVKGPDGREVIDVGPELRKYIQEHDRVRRVYRSVRSGMAPSPLLPDWPHARRRLEAPAHPDDNKPAKAASTESI